MSHLFSKMKDKEDKWDDSNVMHKVSCGGCNKAYIGKTTQYLKKRVSQHKTDANAVLKYGRDTEKTALTEHVN